MQAASQCQASIARIHNKQHVLGAYKFGIASQFIPYYKSGEISHIGVVRNQITDFSANSCARMAVSSKENQDTFIESHFIRCQSHETAEYVFLGSFAINKVCNVFLGEAK